MAQDNQTSSTLPIDKVLAGAPPKAARPAYRPGTKKARLVELLKSAKGVTIEHLAATLGWLPHTTRAALTGLKKDGHNIEKLAPAKGETKSAYRLAKAAAQ